jgi:GNAT superfamily N-acetyltransferase
VTTPQSTSPFDISPLTAHHLPEAQLLSRAVGWAHRLEDWQFAHAIGHGLAATAGGQLVGTTMWWTYDDKVARIGLVIVDRTLQRSGIGRALMLGTLERIRAPSVMLNATLPGEPLYRRLGFEGIGSIVQHQGTPPAAPSLTLRAGERIRPLQRNDLARAVQLDADASGGERAHVIGALFENGEGVVLDDARGIAGFAFTRRSGRGHTIGPVIARDAAGAKALIGHQIGGGTGTFMRIDVPGGCGLSDWLQATGLARVDEVVTMVRGAPPARADEFHGFSIVSQALG